MPMIQTGMAPCPARSLGWPLPCSDMLSGYSSRGAVAASGTALRARWMPHLCTTCSAPYDNDALYSQQFLAAEG